MYHEKIYIEGMNHDVSFHPLKLTAILRQKTLYSYTHLTIVCKHIDLYTTEIDIKVKCFVFKSFTTSKLTNNSK